MDDKPGRPTVEQVTAHMRAHLYLGGGLWMYQRKDAPPGFVILSVKDGVIRWWNDGWRNGIEWLLHCVCIPCDQQGNPLGLVEERDGLRRGVAQMGVLVTFFKRASERAVERDNRDARARLSQAARRVLGLGRLERRLFKNWQDECDAHCVTRSERDEALARASALENDLEIARGCNAALVTESDRLREVNERIHERIRAMQARIGGMESELTLGASMDASHDAHAKVETCGECRWGADPILSITKEGQLVERCSHPAVRQPAHDGVVIEHDDAPPDDCPGPEPREVKP